MMKLSASAFLVGVSFLLSGCLIPFPTIERVPLPSFFGSIVDSKTKKPIQGAKVKVIGHSDTATTTDDHGYFQTRSTKTMQFTLLSSGYTPQKFRLMITAQGYSSKQLQVYRPMMIGNWNLISQGIFIDSILLLKAKVEQGAAANP